MRALIALVVLLSPQAEAQSHYWLRHGNESSGVISPENANRRNGQLAYRAAYSSFLEGRAAGKNKVNPLEHRGRWNKKIVTWHGITLYKDAGGNVALQTPDGKWHVTTPRGEYAFTGIELPTELTREETTLAGGRKKDGRAPASTAQPVYAERPSADPVFDNPLLPK